VSENHEKLTPDFLARTVVPVEVDTHPIEAAVIQLQGQFATGTLTAKVMLPRPG
jgi:hypothetical protein